MLISCRNLMKSLFWRSGSSNSHCACLKKLEASPASLLILLTTVCVIKHVGTLNGFSRVLWCNGHWKLFFVFVYLQPGRHRYGCKMDVVSCSALVRPVRDIRLSNCAGVLPLCAPAVRHRYRRALCSLTREASQFNNSNPCVTIPWTPGSEDGLLSWDLLQAEIRRSSFLQISYHPKISLKTIKSH